MGFEKIIPLTKNVRLLNVQAKGLNCETVVAMTAMWEISLNTLTFVQKLVDVPSKIHSDNVQCHNKIQHYLMYSLFKLRIPCNRFHMWTVDNT